VNFVCKVFLKPGSTGPGGSCYPSRNFWLTIVKMSIVLKSILSMRA